MKISARYLIAEKKYDEAIVLPFKVAETYQRLDDKNGFSSLYADFGLCYAYKKQYDIALNYL